MHNGRLVELHMQIKNSPKNALAKSFDGNGLMIGHTTLRGYFRGVQAQQIIRAANAPNTPAPALEKQPTSTTPAPARNRLPWLAALEAHKPAAATTGIEDKVLGASIGQFFTSAIIVDATTGAFQGAVFAPSESLRAQVVG